MKVKKSFFVLFFSNCLVLFCACGCTAQRSPQRDFKNDSYYFMALKQLDCGNQKEAERFFSLCAKKGSAYCARKSAEEYIKIGNIRERIEKTEAFLRRYDDECALLLAVRTFSSAGEYSKVILHTNGADLNECSNALASLRLGALLQKQDSRFYREMESWFLNRPLSSEHYKFFTANELDYSSVIRFRIEVYRRNYVSALEIYNADGNGFPQEPQIFSDLGKTFLYAAPDYYSCARKFDGFADSSSGEAQFYAYFYAGRLYEKAEKYKTLASQRYMSAMEYAKAQDDGAKYDNALWYLLNLALRGSTEKAISLLKTYCSTWYDADYFDDFLNLLPPLLLSEGNWNAFYDIYQALDGYASNEAVAKYAYIYGRLVQEGIAIPSVGEIAGSESDAAFTRALTSGSDFYYRAMAVYRLGLGGAREEEVLCNTIVDPDASVDTEAETLLLGYAAFGFPEKIYPEYMALYSDGVVISTGVSMKLAAFLNECGENKYEYYPQGLRIAARAFTRTTAPVSKEEMKLLFPRDYKTFVEASCTEFNLPQEALYALIRSESFFDAEIVSSAGAIGLSQLMPDTAADIARKLKMPEFDLRDAETNVRFGAFYLEELNSRLDGAWLPAFFAYNAGITRVRRWIKDSRLSFNSKTALPNDILLEILPFDETRGYGRKLVGAGAMYSWLYDDKPVSESVKEFMR